MYKNDHSIKVVISEGETKGFAKRNNIGRKIAKNEYKADLLYCLNDDNRF